MLIQFAYFNPALVVVIENLDCEPVIFAQVVEVDSHSEQHRNEFQVDLIKAGKVGLRTIILLECEVCLKDA